MHDSVLRFLLAIGSALAIAKVDASEPSLNASMPESQRRFFESYCLSCHNAENQEGKVRLDDLAFSIADIPTAERWQKVLNALNAGEMPPKDEKPPTLIDKTNFLNHLSQMMVTARKKLTDQGGVITMRRLNRREYANTIRDLLGVSVNVKTLPSDVGSGGFDTFGKSLFLSSDQFEQYLVIARKALDEAMLSGPRPETVRVLRECETTANAQLKKAVKLGLEKLEQSNLAIDSGDSKKYGFPDIARAKFIKDQVEKSLPIHEFVLSNPLSKSGAFLTISTGYPLDKTTIPLDAAPGKYLLRVRVGAMENVPSSRRFIEVVQGADEEGAKGEQTVLGCYQVSKGTPTEPQTIEIPIAVRKTGNRTFSIRERQHNDRKAAQRYFLSELASNGVGPTPAVWIDSVEYEGPIIEQWPPNSYQQLMFRGSNGRQDSEYARTIIARFAERAFRGKPVSPLFVSKLADIFENRLKSGLSFEDAIKEPLAIVLASPSFLYLTEESGERPLQHELSSIELASRLSYFVWSSPPDDQLMQLAIRGELRNPEILARQLDRLIDDPKAWSFVTGFLTQWLKMERLDFFQFNPTLFPSFDHSAKLAARDEVFHTFHTIMRENLSLSKLVKSEFVVINDLLAEYYEIEGVDGNHFRKVTVPTDSPRGGMLGMAAVLAMGSDGERSSPVERGAFVMRKMIHSPPPPAPANVPQLSRLEGKVLSARELLSAHMEEAQCAQCHREIDPIGYGLENFDAAGNWREEEMVLQGNDKKVVKGKGRPVAFPIDPSGQLPDGTRFNDYFGLRDAVADRSDLFARGITEAIIEYALGRPFGFTDEELAEEILDSAVHQEYPLRKILHALVLSKPFRMK